MDTASRWQWLLHGADPQTALDAALGLVAEAVPGAEASSITELDGGTYRTSACSSPLALTLDLAQYADAEGPCMTAARDRQHQHVPDTASSLRYSGFVSAAREHGIRSSLSVPIRTAYHPAALNIYSRQVGALDVRGRPAAEFFGRVLTARLGGSVEHFRLTEVENADVTARRQVLASALRIVGPRASTEHAFALLAARSRRDLRSVHDLAAELVAGEQS